MATPEPPQMIELTFEITDAEEFSAYVRAMAWLGASIEPDVTTGAVLLDAVMHLAAGIPGVECFGGEVHPGLADGRQPIAGRAPAMHRHVREHAHPSGGKRHYHASLGEGPWHYRMSEPILKTSLADPQTPDEIRHSVEHDSGGGD